MTKDEKVGWHHRLNGHESEQTPGVGDGQGNLACCSPWGLKELHTTEQLNNSKASSSLPLMLSERHSQALPLEQLALAAVWHHHPEARWSYASFPPCQGQRGQDEYIQTT